MAQRSPIIGVMGPGKISESQTEECKNLGKLIAKNGWVLLTGGGNDGVMNATSEGAAFTVDEKTIIFIL
jgi:uncharacterized protein (TIGR00725 family)